MNIPGHIKTILTNAWVLQIATSVGTTPWICTVCYASDSKYNLYWFSRLSARHSQEIVQNPGVAGAISAPYTLGDKPEGLQYTGRAELVTGEEALVTGLQVMQTRYEFTQERFETLKKELLSGKADYGLYKLSPKEIILHDTKHFPANPRHVYMPTKETE